MQRDGINIDGSLSQPDELTCALTVRCRLLNHRRFACKLWNKFGGCSDGLALRVIIDYSGQMFPVAELVNDCLKLLPRALLEIRFDFVRKTISQYFRSVLQIAAQPQLLKPYLIVGRQ